MDTCVSNKGFADFLKIGNTPLYPNWQRDNVENVGSGGSNPLSGIMNQKEYEFMRWNAVPKVKESPYPTLPGYVPAGTRRIRTKFFWAPTTINETTYWLETQNVEEEAEHNWYGGSEGGMFVDWVIKKVV